MLRELWLQVKEQHANVFYCNSYHNSSADNAYSYIANHNKNIGHACTCLKYLVSEVSCIAAFIQFCYSLIADNTNCSYITRSKRITL